MTKYYLLFIFVSLFVVNVFGGIERKSIADQVIKIDIPEKIVIGDGVLLDETNTENLLLVDDEYSITDDNISLAIYDEVIPLPPNYSKKNGRVLPEPDRTRFTMQDGQIIDILLTTRRPPTTRLRLFPNRQQQITYQPQTTRRPQTFTRFTSQITTATPRSFTRLTWRTTTTTPRSFTRTTMRTTTTTPRPFTPLTWRTTTTTPRSITATTLSTHKPTKDTFSLIGNRQLIQSQQSSAIRNFNHGSMITRRPLVTQQKPFNNQQRVPKPFDKDWRRQFASKAVGPFRILKQQQRMINIDLNRSRQSGQMLLTTTTIRPIRTTGSRFISN